jgi:outer membrane protein assembly factor BamD (BamD/ComL family)
MKYSSFIVIITILLASCAGSQNNEKNQEDELTKAITSLESELFDSGPGRIDRKKAIELINLYTEFADEFPDDAQSPEFLYKASDISMNLRRPVETIQLFDILLTKYPDFDKTPTTLFLKAFVYEDQMQDMERAKKYYEEFLAKYPDSEFADDAEVSLKNLGKTPEELIKEFEENSK